MDVCMIFPLNWRPRGLEGHPGSRVSKVDLYEERIERRKRERKEGEEAFVRELFNQNILRKRIKDENL